MSELKLTISEECAKEMREAFEENRGSTEWRIIARAILLLADKAATVTHYNGGDSVVTGVALDPETERALRRIAEDDDT